MSKRLIDLTVSVVIVNYNSGPLLKECISLILPQVDEVVVVDNASVDSSIVDCEEAFASESVVRVIRNDVNLGFATACNIGFFSTQGDYVLFLNPDCYVESSIVSTLSGELFVDPMVGMDGGLLMNPDGTEQAGGRRSVPTPWRSVVRVFKLQRFAGRWPRLFCEFNLHQQSLPVRPIEVEAISGACMMVKREAIKDVGLWDEGYFLHCEDLDLCMRFRQKGWKILFVPDAKTVHFQGACSRLYPIFVEWHKHKGMMRFYRKFFRHQYPGLLMWVVTLGIWLRFSLKATCCTVKRVSQTLGLERG